MIQIYRFGTARKRREKMANTARETGGKPGVSPGTAAIEHELATLARVLEAAQRKRAYPLERAEFIILRRLAEAGPQNVGALARALLLDDSTMTRQVAALEEKKLVARRRDPADRRAGLVAVTPAGKKAMREMRDLRAARIGGYVAGWSEAERRTLGDLLARLNARLIESLSG
jgi:DNA-binding MarR family transcriptional regulator